MRAYVEELGHHPTDRQLLSEGYTHVVVLFDEDSQDVLDLVDFKSERLAQIYAESVNEGNYDA